MDENPELEEGEACCDKKDDDDKNIDPDVVLGYIDKKIQNILGNFQKDFDVGLSAENLRAIREYGSFLPTYKRPPSVLSQPKTPQRDFSTPRSSDNLPSEGCLQTLKAPTYEPKSSRNQTASCSIRPLHSGFPSADTSLKQDLCVYSSKVFQKTTTKNEESDRLGNPAKKNSIKLRLKVGSDNMVQKVLYNNLGLDNSPSSSLGNSPEDNGGVLPLPVEVIDESPSSILQVMTSFPVPGGVLLSPLHNSLFCPLGNRLSRDGKHVPSLKGSQEYSALSLDDSVATLGSGKQFQEKKAKLLGRIEIPVALKHRDRLGSDDNTDSMKGKLENENALDKENPYNRSIREPLFILEDVGGSVKTAGKASETSGVAYTDVVRDKLVSSAVVKEDSADSNSREDCGQSAKRNVQNRSVEKNPEHRVVNLHKDVSVDLIDGAKCMTNKAFSPFKASSNASNSKYKDRLEVGSTSPPRQKVGRKATFCAHDEISLTCMKSTPLLEGAKKALVIRSNRKPAAVSTKEITEMDEGVAAKHTINIASKSKKLKLKIPKTINKVKDTFKIFPYTKLEQKNYRPSSLERRSGDNSNYSSTGDLEIEPPERKLDGKRVDYLPISREYIKGDPKIDSHITESEHASEAVPSPAKPVDLKDDWVSCDNCGQWRLLPFGTEPEQLPDKWMCSMQDWLRPGMNRCDISQDETTKAVYALYQLPVPESQTNLQHHANLTAFGLPSVNAQRLDQSQQRLKNNVVSIRGKKKDVLRESDRIESSLKRTSKSAKDHLQEPVKSISLNGMNQPHAEPNVMKKSSYCNLSQSKNLIAVKHISKLKDNHTIGGTAKQKMMKTRKASDHFGHGTTKKIKIEDRDHAGEHKNSKMDHGRSGLSSSTGLPAKSGRKNMQKHNQYFDIEDLKCDTKERLPGSLKKASGQAQVFMDGGSVNSRTYNELDLSVKKNMLKKWQQENYNNIKKSEIYAKEESSESGYRKVKKVKVLNSARSESGANKKGKVMQILSTGNQEKPADGAVKEVRNMNESQQPCKNIRKLGSEQILVGADSLRRHFGPEQVSVAVTSSSSKVSGSCKTRAIFEEVKGSPVESVSSSLLRTSHPGKTTSAQLDNLVKNEAMKCGPFVGSNKFKRCLNGEGNAENNGCAVTRKDRLDYQIEDTNCLIGDKARLSSDLLNVDADVIEHYVFPGDLQPGYDEEVENHGMVTFSQKSGIGNAVRSKDGRCSMSDFERDENKVLNSLKIQADFSFNKSKEYVPENHNQPSHEKKNVVKNNTSDKSSTKCSRDEKKQASSRDFVGKCSMHRRLEENRLNPEGLDDSDKKLDAICSINGVNHLQHTIQEFEDESKGDPNHLGSRNDLSKSVSHYEDGSKQETQRNRTDPELQLGGLIEGYPVSASVNGNTLKALNHCTNSGSKNESCHSLGHSIPDTRRVRDSDGSGHGRMISSSQAANNALKKAKDSREYADRLKSSGFAFETNEVFQASLEFLHGAFLLETCNSESGKRWEMSQMQVYSTTAELFEFCAREYERRQEMAFAALAYKCMWVAYMRVIYCKHFSMNGVRDELQATLQRAPQGESPSSSASDLDNLNNQPVVKATPSNGAVSHVAGARVIVAQNQPNFVRLLDFTRNVNCAMEASTKSENAFKRANFTLEVSKNRECIASIRRVVDFSFQDVEGLIHLVLLAREAISRSGFGVAGD